MEEDTEYLKLPIDDQCVHKVNIYIYIIIIKSLNFPMILNKFY